MEILWLKENEVKGYTLVSHGLTWECLESVKTQTLLILKVKTVLTHEGLLRPAPTLTYSTKPESYAHAPVGKLSHRVQVKDWWEKDVKARQREENFTGETDELLMTTSEIKKKKTATNPN